MSTDKRIKKRLKEVKEYKKKVNKRFKEVFFLTEEYKKKQASAHKKLLASAYETNKEKEIWKKYEKETLESFKTDNPDQKFRLQKIEDLGLNYDILFLYSKKDIGKTTQMAKKIERIKAQDPNAQICFIRNTREELKGFAEAMNNSDIWPCWTNGEYVWWKSDLKKAKKKDRTNIKPCGFMAYASEYGLGFVKWQGGDWNRLRVWFWDECNSVEGGLTHVVFQRVVVLLSSLNRDKDGDSRVKGYMFGNLLEKKNIFLDRLGVGSHTRLKIFDVHKDNDPKKEILSRLLYVNTGDMFKGIENQKGLATQFLTPEEELSYLHNRPGTDEVKCQYEELELKHFKSLFAFVFSKKAESTRGIEKKSFHICYVYKIPNSLRLVCWIEPYKKDTIIKPGFKLILCFEDMIANKFPKCALLEEEDFAEYIEFLKTYVDIGEIWFGWQGSQEIFEEVWEKWRTKFIKEDENEK